MNIRYFNILLLLKVLFLTSFTQYQYLEFGSKVPVQNNVFVFENDSIKFTYDFKGRNTPFRFYLENKTEQTIFIDWEKSGLVYNGQTVPFYVNKSEVYLESAGASPLLTGIKELSTVIHLG